MYAYSDSILNKKIKEIKKKSKVQAGTEFPAPGKAKRRKKKIENRSEKKEKGKGEQK